MSFAGFDTFDACLIYMKEKQGYSEEIAKKVCGKLQAESENSENAATKSHSGKEAAILAFAQKPVEFTDMPNGDVVFHNVTLLAEGKWIDKHSRKSIKYSGSELIKGTWEKRTFKAQHDIYDELPVTNEIGAIENEKFVTTPTPRWIGDVRVFPTQLGKDIATLLKRKQIKGISTEVFHVLVPDAAGELQSTEEIFMGAATVRQGACSLCTFNEGDETTTEHSKDEMKNMLSYMKSHPEMVDDDMKGMMKSMMGMAKPAQNEGDKQTMGTESGGSADPAISALEKQLQDAVTNKSSDVAVLTTQLEEVKKIKGQQAFAELESMRKRVAELESVNGELLKKFAQQDHDNRVRDLQRQIAELSKQPVIHTQITGGGSSIGAKAAELDSGDYPAISVQEFGD